MKRLLVLLVMFLLALTGTAHADNASQVATALRSSPVYQAQGLDLVDVAGLQSTLQGSDPPVYVAVLTAAAASSATDAHARASEIGKDLGVSDAVVLVITASKHLGAAEGSGAASRGVQAGADLKAVLADASGKAFDKGNITALAGAFAQRVASEASSGSGTTSGGSGGGYVSTPQTTGSSHGGAYFLGALALLGGGGVVLAKRSSRRRKAQQNDGLRTDVEQLYNRLGSDVSTLDAGSDPVVKQAMADAAERYNACGAVLATADSPAEFASARRTAVEGLTAARTARMKLGLDPGPEIPLPPGAGPQLTGNQAIQVGDEQYDGSASYQPGRQHYFGGGNLRGQMVPGGWYSTPFWEPFLLGSMLSGGFGGGGLFGGGYGGGGFDRGYEEGREDARDDARDDSGGGGGMFGGGGDWGGGGGGGGGDWGGGGGDSGGGGDW